MKIQTEEDLQAGLDKEFGWRRIELTAIKFDIQSAKADNVRSVKIRAGVALLYAHWEGFVKAAAEMFIEFVSVRRLSYAELAPGLLSLAMRQQLMEFGERKSIVGHIDFISFLQKDMGLRAKIPTIGVIKTGSNLNSERMRDIVLTLGLDYSAYELKANLIDKSLLDWRNTIAHGKELCPTMADFEVLYVEITKLLGLFKDQLENAVALKEYRRGPIVGKN